MALEAYELFHGGEAEHARAVVGRVLGPHRVRHTTRLDVRVRSRRMRDVSVTQLGYGGDVTVDFGQLRSFFLVQVPVSGRAQVRAGELSVRSEPGLATVLSPDVPGSVRWSADCVQLMVRIERTALRARLAGMIGTALHRELRFEPAMDVGSGYGHGWLLALHAIVHQLDRPGSLIENAAMAEAFEQVLMSALLTAQPSNYSHILRGEARAAPSKAVGIALDWIESHPKAGHTTASLARAAGVTERALQLGFRKHLDMRPMEYLREIRLQRVHEQLKTETADGRTVTEIALEWGFAHQGHFATRYQRRFGEKPSETLRR
ncbi:AraC family transcriptional regulator [Amycolatopsis sp.]|uniref:AraC family transcriptional regulator n=1 Tax=Amycolatopsis sp. TaxID=37632 RepID=UPI002C9939B2|nr:AraC family transcriptional regulator [Amycolatopsis sp.]HVV10533.1 AraC family transcriptional regulator [Amycolatopsis sp.]